MKNILLLLVIVTTTALGSPLPDYPFVYARGDGKTAVAPTEATISFQIKTESADASDAYAAQSKISSEILKFAGSLKIAPECIIAEPIEKIAKEEGYGKDKKVVGYELKRDVTIKVLDLSPYPQFIEFLYKQNHIDSIRSYFDISDKEKLSEALLKDACKIAMKKAEALASGFSKKIKAVKAISDSHFDEIERPFGLSASSISYAASMSSSQDEINFRFIPLTISFERTVYLICEIE